MKVKSTAEARLRLNKLAEKIDKLIAIEEAMLPDCATLHIITDEETLKSHTYSKGRYIKFGLIFYVGCLPDA